MIRIPIGVAVIALAGCATTSVGPAIPDAETRAWWALTSALSNDAMEGRDTGSAGYDRAADLVAKRLRAAGLRPAGDGGTFFQRIRMREVRVEEAGTSFTVVGGDGHRRPLRFLHDLTITAAAALPATINASLSFRGYCRRADLGKITGKVAVCFNTRRAGMTTAAERVAAVTAAGAAGLIQVDDPSFILEPPRWPVAYARSVSAYGAPRPCPALPYP